MFDNGLPAHPPEQFNSAKTTTPIPLRHPMIKEALIQLSLDASVRSIDYIPSANVGAEDVELDAIIVERDSGRFLLDIVPARPIRDLEDEGLALIALSEFGLPTLAMTLESLRQEPRFSNSRLVWLYSRHCVPLELRIRVLEVLSERQSMKLGALLRQIEGGSRGSRAVMALACANLIELDLSSQPLGPTTIVTPRGKIGPGLSRPSKKSA